MSQNDWKWHKRIYHPQTKPIRPLWWRWRVYTRRWQGGHRGRTSVSSTCIENQ